MMKILAMARKELKIYFASPIAYVVMTSFLLVSGFFFTGQMANYARLSAPAEFTETLQAIMFLTVLISPLVTMRLVAEEKFRGTMETLFTAPVSEFQVLMGKFLGSMVFYAVIVMPTFVYIILMSFFTSLDMNAVCMGYIGLFLFASALFSIGLLISSLFNSQVSAGVVTLILSFLLVSINVASVLVDEGSALKVILTSISFLNNIGPFFSGRFDTRPLIFFITICIGALISSVKLVEQRRVP